MADENKRTLLHLHSLAVGLWPDLYKLMPMPSDDLDDVVTYLANQASREIVVRHPRSIPALDAAISSLAKELPLWAEELFQRWRRRCEECCPWDAAVSCDECGAYREAERQIRRAVRGEP
jgi:hypothetical protein